MAPAMAVAMLTVAALLAAALLAVAMLAVLLRLERRGQGNQAAHRPPPTCSGSRAWRSGSAGGTMAGNLPERCSRCSPPGRGRWAAWLP